MKMFYEPPAYLWELACLFYVLSTCIAAPPSRIKCPMQPAGSETERGMFRVNLESPETAFIAHLMS